MSGELREGDSIGTHNELSERYNTSLITIRRALEGLKYEKILISRMGKGTFVAPRGAGKVRPTTDHKTIGFVLQKLDVHFFSNILRGAESRINKTEYRLIVSSSMGSIGGEEAAIRHMMDLGVCGLIIASLSREYDANHFMTLLGHNNFPYVFVSYVKDPNINYIGSDHQLIAFMGTMHLINLGNASIGYICSEKGNVIGNLRYKGYRDALAAHGLNSTNNMHVFYPSKGGDEYYFASGYELGKNIAQMSKRPRAFFIYNDLIAVGFMSALLDSGINIPADIAIVGVDNIKEGETAAVALTTVHQPKEKIGAAAVDTIIRMNENQVVPTRQLFKPELIIRDSCGSTV